MLLYYITDRKQFPGDEPTRRERLLQKIEEAAHAGVDYIQLREKDLSSCELEQLAREAMVCVVETKSKLLINSRTDVALAVGAHGIHLRSNDISPEDVRKVWRRAGISTAPIIAVSCHTEPEVGSAERARAGFAVFGPVFEKSQQPATGLGLLRSVCRHDVPVFALGGVALENVRCCQEAGAAGVAGIRLFQQGSVAEVVEKLRG